ncbi:MAG: hypothetical protein N2385_14740, partial [Chloroflexus sp.]|nr:hypothetical protein [Chloroflexus sp.]
MFFATDAQQNTTPQSRLFQSAMRIFVFCNMLDTTRSTYPDRFQSAMRIFVFCNQVDGQRLGPVGPGFNPRCGFLFFATRPVPPPPPGLSAFQSAMRIFVFCNAPASRPAARRRSGFNPRCGFLFFAT